MKKAERRALLGKTELYLISAIFVRLGLQPLDGTGQSPRGVADGSRNQDDEQSSARQVRIRSILICHERERCDETPGSHSPAPNFVECEDVDTCTSLPSLLSHRRKSRRHRRILGTKKPGRLDKSLPCVAVRTRSLVRRARISKIKPR
jgi:hypothetical protein